MNERFSITINRQGWIALLIILLLLGHSSAFADWRLLSGGRADITTGITEIDVGADGLMSISTADATPRNGSCPNAGAVYFSATQPYAKYLYAAALTANSLRLQAYLMIDCDPTYNRARLMRIQVR